ncbi:MAG TPA: acyl-ACP desaturase [Abditibacteriaceae bacterium]
MSARSVQARMEDFFYRELIKYLKLAEEKRRWNQFRDIPWDEANPNTTETLANCVETFCSVENYLPDFTSKLLCMIRKSRGRAWFHINWGYEESKHSMTLEMWLLASGHRTDEQREELEKILMDAEWELPFDHPRQMVIYTMIQELATFWNYRNLEKMAAEQQDAALVTALRIISVDERVHYNFFRNCVKEWMKHDDRGTVEDIKYVFDNFTMPGNAQIPNYDEAARVLAATGIYGPREYVKLVKNPILEDLGLSRDFHLMESKEIELRQERAAIMEAMKREQITLSNGHAIPKNGSPLNGKSPHMGRPSPMLEAADVIPKVRTESSRSIILGTENEPLPGSRGMDKYDELDQRLMARGDELSNNAEEMREERAKIRRNRGKNSRLLGKHINPAPKDESK